MNKRIIHDDGDLIWFDFENLDVEALDNTVISTFDITNMPTKQFGYNILGVPRMEPDFFELKNYYTTFYEDHLSNTGWSCMCINKNKDIYKSHIGYDENRKPIANEY